MVSASKLVFLGLAAVARADDTTDTTVADDTTDTTVADDSTDTTMADDSTDTTMADDTTDTTMADDTTDTTMADDTTDTTMADDSTDTTMADDSSTTMASGSTTAASGSTTHHLSAGAGGKCAIQVTVQTDFATRPANFDAMAYANIFAACCNSDSTTYSMDMTLVSGSIIITAVITSNDADIPALSAATTLATAVTSHDATKFDQNFISFVAEATAATPVVITVSNAASYDTSSWTTPAPGAYTMPTITTAAPTTTSSAFKATTAAATLLLSSIAVLLL